MVIVGLVLYVSGCRGPKRDARRLQGDCRACRFAAMPRGSITRSGQAKMWPWCWGQPIRPRRERLGSTLGCRSGIRSSSTSRWAASTTSVRGCRTTCRTSASPSTASRIRSSTRLRRELHVRWALADPNVRLEGDVVAELDSGFRLYRINRGEPLASGPANGPRPDQNIRVVGCDSLCAWKLPEFLPLRRSLLVREQARRPRKRGSAAERSPSSQSRYRRWSSAEKASRGFASHSRPPAAASCSAASGSARTGVPAASRSVRSSSSSLTPATRGRG